ncbi:MAG: NADPH-dependent FMN reductase [Myxococcota bacterium]
MKVVTICGSLRTDSSTRRALLVSAAAARDAGASVEFIHLGDFDLSFCDGRTDESTYGGDTQRFIEIISGADGLLIGTPNYHGSFTGVLKNALDLLGPDAIRDKLIGLVATGRGDAGAMNTLNHLRHVCRWMNGWVIPAEVSIPRAQEAFDESGAPVRDDLEGQLQTLGKELVRYAGLLER